MIGDLFDSPWKVLIVAAVLIVLFGTKKLPDAARSLGRSMRILRTEVSGLQRDEFDAAAEAPDSMSGATSSGEEASDGQLSRIQR
jgi:sec-independent protein translocase protein TatA